MNVGKREKWWEVVRDGKKPEGGQHHCKKTALFFSQKCLLCN